MSSPYSSTTVSGYNSNPPVDDGSTGASNRVQWSSVKTKIGDPLNTYASAQNTALVNAFGKTLDGASVATTAVDYTATASDQGRLIKFTVSGKTLNAPDATVVGAPFVFAFLNLSGGTITLAGQAAQTIDGQTTQVIRNGSGGFLFTDGSNWFTSGLKAAQLQSTNPPYGFDVPINLQLTASVATNILTIAVKTNSGNDPTASDPVLIPFRDSTLTAGDPVWVAVTSALSINTNAVGATLGSSNTVPFRFRICAFNNAGAVVLALINCSTQSATAVQIFPLNESGVASTTGISAAATSAGVFYTPNGTTLTSKAFRVIGHLDYESGLTTAGTYATAPTTVQLFGPGIKLPGAVVQTVYSSTTTTTNATSTAKAATALTATLTPTSAINPVEVQAYGWMGSGSATNNQAGFVQLYRNSGATAIGNISGFVTQVAGASTVACGTANYALDNPQSSSSTQYGLYIADGTGTNTITFLTTQGTAPTNTGTLCVKELMG